MAAPRRESFDDMLTKIKAVVKAKAHKAPQDEAKIVGAGHLVQQSGSPAVSDAHPPQSPSRNRNSSAPSHTSDGGDKTSISASIVGLAASSTKNNPLKRGAPVDSDDVDSRNVRPRTSNALVTDDVVPLTQPNSSKRKATASVDVNQSNRKRRKDSTSSEDPPKWVATLKKPLKKTASKGRRAAAADAEVERQIKEALFRENEADEENDLGIKSSDHASPMKKRVKVSGNSDKENSPEQPVTTKTGTRPIAPLRAKSTVLGARSTNTKIAAATATSAASGNGAPATSSKQTAAATVSSKTVPVTAVENTATSAASQETQSKDSPKPASTKHSSSQVSASETETLAGSSVTGSENAIRFASTPKTAETPKQQKIIMRYQIPIFIHGFRRRTNAWIDKKEAEGFIINDAEYEEYPEPQTAAEKQRHRRRMKKVIAFNAHMRRKREHWLRKQAKAAQELEDEERQERNRVTKPPEDILIFFHDSPDRSEEQLFIPKTKWSRSVSISGTKPDLTSKQLAAATKRRVQEEKAEEDRALAEEALLEKNKARRADVKEKKDQYDAHPHQRLYTEAELKMLGENGMRRLVNRLEKRGRYAEAAAMEERIHSERRKDIDISKKHGGKWFPRADRKPVPSPWA